MWARAEMSACPPALGYPSREGRLPTGRPPSRPSFGVPSEGAFLLVGSVAPPPTVHAHRSPAVVAPSSPWPFLVAPVGSQGPLECRSHGEPDQVDAQCACVWRAARASCTDVACEE